LKGLFPANNNNLFAGVNNGNQEDNLGIIDKNYTFMDGIGY